MSIHDGVVTLEEDDVQVILGLDDDKIRLSAGGLEIGEWSSEDCSIDPAGDGVFTITAENETLTFVPNNPMTFIAAMNGGDLAETTPDQAVNESVEPAVITENESDQIPDPKPVTKIVFYALATVTGILGLWALISIIF